ncbi:hypothetical protein NPN19_24990, partial [Vibrio parahaemolyticus]|uniref:hypothetical protein n=1 Tax=Vibrio parahaemolyticus TaxID=670 RepID=UPI003F6838CA|nr:hypothetical protein [Vibrio parahaemolyticus]
NVGAQYVLYSSASGNVNAPALQMQLMLVQTGEIICQVKVRSNNNNPLTRDEILSRYFPQYRPAVATSQGLSGGSCIIAHDTHRVV